MPKAADHSWSKRTIGIAPHHRRSAIYIERPNFARQLGGLSPVKKGNMPTLQRYDSVRHAINSHCPAPRTKFYVVRKRL